MQQDQKIEKKTEDTDQVTNNLKSNPSLDWAEKLKLLFEIGPKIVAVGISFLYISGFLVQTAHLNKYNIIDFELLNARYLITGSIFTFYLICFYLFGGRAIVLIKEWLSDDINRLIEIGAGKTWHFIAFIESFVHVTFMLCLSAATFSSIAFAQIETLFFYAILSVGFFIHYTLDITNIDIRYPKANLIINLITKVAAIIIFFNFTLTPNPINVFFSFFLIAIYINFVLDHYERYRFSTEKFIFSSVHTCVFILICAVTFGVLFHGNVTRKIGGGLPISVKIGLSESLPNSMYTNTETNITEGINTEIIFMSSDHIYIQVDNIIFRIPESEVKWIRMNKETEPQPTEIFERFIQPDKTSTNESNKTNNTNN